MCNQFSPGLPKYLGSVKVKIGFPVVRTGTVALAGGRSVGSRSSDYQIFWVWVDLLSYGAPRARVELR